MPLVFPSKGALASVFVSLHPLPHQEKDAKPQPAKVAATASPQQRNIFPAWSAIDDVKNKAGALGSEAAKELDKASQAAQKKTGKIELYSGKYYASCIFGGMMACVSIAKHLCSVYSFPSLLHLHAHLQPAHLDKIYSNCGASLSRA